MAAEISGIEYTVTGTATTLTAATGGTRKFIRDLSIRANPGNGNNVYLGGSTVTTAANRWVVLQPGEGWALSLPAVVFSTDQIFIIGTAGTDKLHIVMGS